MQMPRTIGELKDSEFNQSRLLRYSMKDEMRRNLIGKLERGETVFPGIIGYDDSVTPQIVNAILSRHHFILLGEHMPAVEGCEINDNPFAPICKSCRIMIEERGDQTPVIFIPRANRYVE